MRDDLPASVQVSLMLMGRLIAATGHALWMLGSLTIGASGVLLVIPATSFPAPWPLYTVGSAIAAILLQAIGIAMIVMARPWHENDPRPAFREQLWTQWRLRFLKEFSFSVALFFIPPTFANVVGLQFWCLPYGAAGVAAFLVSRHFGRQKGDSLS